MTARAPPDWSSRFVAAAGAAACPRRTIGVSRGVNMGDAIGMNRRDASSVCRGLCTLLFGVRVRPRVFPYTTESNMAGCVCFGAVTIG